jgi:hypothetical protein
MVFAQLCTFVTDSTYILFYNIFSELCIYAQAMLHAKKHTLYMDKLSAFLDSICVQLSMNDHAFLDNIHNCCIIQISS